MTVLQSFTITRPDDWHNHARQEAMMHKIVNHTARYFGRVVWMPNTLPPILEGYQAVEYGQQIVDAATDANPEFKPVMTLKLTKLTTPGMIQAAFELGVRVVKYYPEGVTTNAEDGIHPDELEHVYRVFREMEKYDMVLCVHGEHPDGEARLREEEFLPILDKLVEAFPKLRMVLEHVSSARAVAKILELPDTVAATVTAHHLYLTHTDLYGGKLKPHYFCKPPVKDNHDMQVLWNVVGAGNPKFFFGSDSAGHPQEGKEGHECAAGVFTGPLMLPLLAHMFEQHGFLHLLEGFVSLHGAKFYRFEPNRDRIRLEKRNEVFEPKAPKGLVLMPFRDDLETGNPEKIFWHVAEVV